MQCVIDCRKRLKIPLEADENFLLFLLQNAMRFGFTDFLILQDKNNPLPSFALTEHPDLKARSVEKAEIEENLPLPQALSLVSYRLEPVFLFIDGNECLDFNWLDLWGRYKKSGRMQLAFYKDALNRQEKWASVALLKRDSFEAYEKLPVADAANTWLKMLLNDNFAQPVEYEGKLRAPDNLKGSVLPRRGAVFLDRDGVLNRDFGYVHSYENWEWIAGAMEMIKEMNDRGLFVFVVTNQSGIARGYYKEADVAMLHAQIQKDLRQIGAHIDAFRFCPYHPEAVVEAYRKKSDWRKPGAGMLEDLLHYWPIDKNKSFLIGDKESDIAAAKACNLPAYFFRGEKLDLKLCGENIKFYT